MNGEYENPRRYKCRLPSLRVWPRLVLANTENIARTRPAKEPSELPFSNASFSVGNAELPKIRT